MKISPVLRCAPVLALLAVVLMTSGCKHAVTFQRHAPYQSAHTYKAPLIVLIPDDIDELSYSVKFGMFPEPKSFKVFYGQALKEETAARFAHMYSRVVFVDEMMYEAAMDPVLDLNGIVNDDLGMQGVSVPDDLAEEEIDADLLKILRAREGYSLRYKAIDYSMSDDMAMIAVNAVFTDRFTDQVLFEGRLSGTGHPVRSYNAIGNLTEELKRSTVGACGAALIRLSRNMVEGIEGAENRR